MAKNTSILLGQYFEKFIKSEVSSGKYGSAREVVKTALRMLESGEEKKSVLLKALIHGEKSKRVENFDPKNSKSFKPPMHFFPARLQYHLIN